MYLVFGGERYYATGGAFDLLESFNDKAEAEEYAASVIGKRVEWDDEYWRAESKCSPVEWSHVLDVENREVTAEFGESPLGMGRMADRVVDENNH